MDIYQLQRQIQDLRQEVNNINQVASQLQRSEANNAAQLQRLHQNEAIATQQLHTIQQLCNRLNQDVNVMGMPGNIAGAYTSNLGTGITPFASNVSLETPQQRGYAIGPFASNIGLETPNQQTRTSQFGVSGFAGMPFASNIGLETPQQQRFASAPFASNIGLEVPQHMQSSQYGSTGFAAGSYLSPYSASHISTLPTTGFMSQPLTSSQNLGMYGSF